MPLLTFKETHMTKALSNLRTRWGLSDSEIAHALHTNPSVIHRWRRGAELDDVQVALADLLSDFCDDLHEVDCEPGAFMSAPLVDGYTATGWDLYAAGRPELLIAHARGELSAKEALAAHDSDWRRTYWTSLKTVQAGDGNLSIVGKSYDDVQAQIQDAQR
jgi:ABC-type taurine transport system substrate-binding protein